MKLANPVAAPKGVLSWSYYGKRKVRQARRRVDLYAVLALALTLFAWAPLLSSSYFMGAHDAPHSLFFPLQFDKGIRDGFWLPRWGPDIAHGYGYPLLVFYAPLSFYIWESFRLTSLFGVVASTKATFVVGFLLGAAGMYAYVRTVWDRRAALLASVVYTYLPYHLVDIYVRAVLAEFVAMGLLPWIMLAFHHLVRRPSLLSAAGATVAYGALLWTHNITAVLFTPLLGAYILFELAGVAYTKGNGIKALRGVVAGRIVPIAGSIFLAVALGTAVWLPSLAEQGAIKINQWAMQTYQYADHFVSPHQLISPFWGFGYSVPGDGDGMPFQLGLAALLLALIGVAGVWVRRGIESASSLREARVQQAALLFHGVSLLILVVLMLPLAITVWDLSPVATLIQFPWRLLAVVALPLSVLAGSAARLLSPPHEDFAPGLLLAILLVLGGSRAYTQPQFTPANPRNETQQVWRDYEAKHPDMVGMVAQTEVQPADSPMLPALQANQVPQRFTTATPGADVTQLYTGGGSAHALVESERPATIGFLTYWYPGWSATVDGRPVTTRPDESPLGLIEVDVPAGEHLLVLRFEDPPLRRAANLVSLVSLVILVSLVGIAAKRKLTSADTISLTA